MAKFIFIVQGEGKGHMTQAIAMYQILLAAEHQVLATIIGITDGRKIPDFFMEDCPVPMHTIESPSLKYGKRKSPSLLATIFGNLYNVKKYLANADIVNAVVEKYNPDMIINFYEMSGGFYNLFYKPSIPSVCVGHQYLLLNQNFQTIKTKPIDRFLLNINTKITAFGATSKLALSFVPMPNDDKKNIIVCPPLLREAAKEAYVETGDYLLAYVTHHKILEYITTWQSKHSGVKMHCFVDKKDIIEGQEIQKNLFIHKVNAVNFLEKLSKCKALVTTAGFESVCEAMYMGKPVMMVPVRNHIEQRINAFDGQRAGAGLASKKFKLNKFIKYLTEHSDVSVQFQAWENNASSIFIKSVETILENYQSKNAVKVSKIKKQKYSIKNLMFEYFTRKWNQLSPY